MERLQKDNGKCTQAGNIHQKGWVVLNTDGAFRGNSGPAGGVLRGYRGEWLRSFAEGMGHCTLMKAEIKAVYKGLQLTNSMNIPKLGVQLDAQIVAGSSAWTMERAPLLRRCTNLSKSYAWEIRVTHYYREANQVADKLADMGVELSSCCNVY